MDGRTRVIHAIERKPLDRIPRFDGLWEDTVTEWEAQGMPKGTDVAELFDWDIRCMFIDASMRAESKVLEKDGEFIVYQDRAGYTVRKIIGKSRALEFVDHVTKDRATWDRLKGGFAFDPEAPARLDTKSYFMHLDEYPPWDEVKAGYDRLRATGAYLLFTAYGPWEGTWRHRGYSELLMDLAMDPEWAAEMAATQCGTVMATVEHAMGLGMKPDGLWLTEDLAGTSGLLFSPDMWRQVYRPCFERLGAFLRDHGIGFWIHSCGNGEALFPDLIECGVEVIQPLQATAGLDVRTLKPRYGDAVTLWGNMDVTKMSGPREACEAEIRDKTTAAKVGGGYMYHSDHSIPPEVTWERYQWIMALVDECGK